MNDAQPEGMRMSDRNDIMGVLGAILSTILAALGFLWSIGFLQLIFTFLTGSLATYVFQHRLQIESEKREIERQSALEMRDEIYGPLFMELSTALENVESFAPLGYAISEELKETVAHFLFFTIREDLKRKTSELLDRIGKYGSIRRAAELVVQEHIRREVQNRYQVDIESVEYKPDLSLRIGKVHIASISLMNALFRNVEPQEFVKSEIQKWGDGIAVEVEIGGKRDYDLDSFSTLRSSVASATEGEPLFREERKQRSLLIEELRSYLKEIQPFVNPERSVASS
jgi:hypothetical protein